MDSQDCLDGSFRSPPVIAYKRRRDHSDKKNIKMPVVRRKEHSRGTEFEDITSGNSRRRRKRKGIPIKDGVSLVMGQVKLLRRGESLDSPKVDGSYHNLEEEVNTRGGEKAVPIPKKTHMKAAAESPGYALYSGYAFIDSPSPQAVSFPSFLYESVTKELTTVLQLR